MSKILQMLEEMKLFYEERLNATESLVTTYKRNVQELTREVLFYIRVTLPQDVFFILAGCTL
jgi:hypothetical protein